MAIAERERPVGVIVQFGGQTPLSSRAVGAGGRFADSWDDADAIRPRRRIASGLRDGHEARLATAGRCAGATGPTDAVAARRK